jgi:hypothetical protein
LNGHQNGYSVMATGQASAPSTSRVGNAKHSVARLSR